MKVAIMQPYFLPYIGYFQLINAVDVFVIYDNIEFTKKGWINRNRILVNGKDDYFTLPLKKASDFLNVNQRELSESYHKDSIKILSKIAELYKKAPQYNEVFPLIEKVFMFENQNLFDFIFNSLKIFCNYLEIKTNFVVSSSVLIDHSLKSQNKVIAICKQLQATNYINAIGGQELYDKEMFEKNKIELNFIKTDPIKYKQFDNDFIPWLSIIDVIMFNSLEESKLLLNKYKLVWKV
ncbi:WbqC-like protein [Flavobacterium sp. 103]|uniref:WbqC family protein n=1 Tax=Flavobacterium sp. 103 TaxID=2135624 RepID=UPI000D5D6807|nr:WbqC family protein [Flavobacterium sp. 103]PVX46610.1 WbqC-like protein [Flavobacterium sp. 103]